MQASILIIDDEQSITDLLSAALRASGFEVVVANSGEDGVRRMKEAPPQIVVMDLVMPQMDGWQTCKAIRQFSRVPILILSPLDEPAVVASILDAGADECLLKPVPTSLLVAHLNQLARRTGALPARVRDNPAWHPSTRPLPS